MTEWTLAEDGGVESQLLRQAGAKLELSPSLDPPMNALESNTSVPPRLTRAVWIWLALTPLVAILPRGSLETVGLLAHPVFWCALLPAMVLAPYWRHCLPQSSSENVKRARSKGRQARRRPRSRTDLRRAA